MKDLDKEELKQYIKEVMYDHLNDIYDGGREHAGEFDVEEEDEEEFEEEWIKISCSIINDMKEKGCL